MEGKIIFTGKTSKDNSIIIRYPKSSDAKAMCEYINALSKERTFIGFQGEKIPLDEETKYLKKQLEKIAKKMYEKFGFHEYGNLPNGVKLPDGYVNHIYMYKKIK